MRAKYTRKTRAGLTGPQTIDAGSARAPSHPGQCHHNWLQDSSVRLGWQTEDNSDLRCPNLNPLNHGPNDLPLGGPVWFSQMRLQKTR